MSYASRRQKEVGAYHWNTQANVENDLFLFDDWRFTQNKRPQILIYIIKDGRRPRNQILESAFFQIRSTNSIAPGSLQVDPNPSDHCDLGLVLGTHSVCVESLIRSCEMYLCEITNTSSAALEADPVVLSLRPGSSRCDPGLEIQRPWFEVVCFGHCILA